MARFTKRPVTIDAILADEVLDGASTGRFAPSTLRPGEELMPQWIIDAFNNMTIGFELNAVLVNTHHGQVRAERDAWIIRGVDGEIYPCVPDVFARTYDPGDGQLSHGEPITLRIEGDMSPERFAEFRKKWEFAHSSISKLMLVDSGTTPIVDQPPPTPQGDKRAVWELVIEEYRGRNVNNEFDMRAIADVLDDMTARDAIGRERYGTPLTAFNGRDQLVDAYQEKLDAAVYLRAAMLEGMPVSGIYELTLDSITWLRCFINERAAKKS